MAKIVVPLVVVVVILAMAAAAGWFLFNVVRGLLRAILQILGGLRGQATFRDDPRNSPANPELIRLRDLARQVSTYQPRRPTAAPPRPIPYKSVLGFVPYRLVPMFNSEDELEFFASEQMEQRTENVPFVVRHLPPNQRVSETPLLTDIASLQQPAPLTIDNAVANALATMHAYPQRAVDHIAEERIADLGQIPGPFDVPAPLLRLPLWPFPLSVFNGLVRSANADKVKAYEAAVKSWRTLEYDYNAAREQLKVGLLELQHRLAIADESRLRVLEEANAALSADRTRWEARQSAEVEFLRKTLDDWHSGYLADPAALAKLVLELTLFSRWFPIAVSSTFDADSGVLIVDTEFPDVGQLAWQKFQGGKVKPATKAETRDANERLYPALAIRYAWEVARAANESLVKTVVLNGWTDYIDRSTGETKRAYVSSLLADIDKLRQLNLPAIDVLQAFAALKGVSARAQTVVPVAPIVTMTTDDPRFVDAREVLNGMSFEQNLATMDWEDFEHLCRELFEREFASDGAEVKITQASRDAGVDAIIFNPDPIKGGKIVVQAKRYAGTVDVSAVRDLYGTVHNEGAMKGILVTTSTFGSDAYNFIAHKPLTLINGGQLLQLLERHGYRFRIDLVEAKKAARERWAPKRGQEGGQ